MVGRSIQEGTFLGTRAKSVWRSFIPLFLAEEYADLMVRAPQPSPEQEGEDLRLRMA